MVGNLEGRSAGGDSCDAGSHRTASGRQYRTSSSRRRVLAESARRPAQARHVRYAGRLPARRGDGMNVIRTIHVGVGGRGRWPIEVMGRDPNYQPVAVVDVNPDFLAEARATLDLPEGA